MVPYTGRNPRTETYLRAMQFDRPAWTPAVVSLMPATWMKYREDLEALVLAHPKLFPKYRKGSKDFDAVPDPAHEPGRATDAWGCVWENAERGLAGMVVGHPLADWDALEAYTPPDPLTQDLWRPRPPWDEVRASLEAAKARGDLAVGSGLAHGFFYMTLYYLRGFEAFMLDLAREDPRLARLIEMVEHYDVTVVRQYLDLGAERIGLGEDLGLQRSLPISPAAWRRWIKPSYERILGPCRDRGVPVRLHSDGHILPIIPDLVEVGVRVLNPQVRANGLEGLAEVARGKVCLDLDLDRQLFPFATPSELEDHIGEAHEALALPEGGLMMVAEAEPDLSLETIDVICSALERVCRLPEPGPGGQDA